MDRTGGRRIERHEDELAALRDDRAGELHLALAVAFTLRLDDEMGLPAVARNALLGDEADNRILIGDLGSREGEKNTGYQPAIEIVPPSTPGTPGRFNYHAPLHAHSHRRILLTALLQQARRNARHAPK
jgi:hypothetical protein